MTFVSVYTVLFPGGAEARGFGVRYGAAGSAPGGAQPGRTRRARERVGSRAARGTGRTS